MSLLRNVRSFASVSFFPPSLRRRELTPRKTSTKVRDKIKKKFSPVCLDVHSGFRIRLKRVSPRVVRESNASLRVDEIRLSSRFDRPTIGASSSRVDSTRVYFFFLSFFLFFFPFFFKRGADVFNRLSRRNA